MVCPLSHPYAFNNGIHCCKMEETAIGGGNGSLLPADCDGRPVEFESSLACCQNADHVPCPRPHRCRDVVKATHWSSWTEWAESPCNPVTDSISRQRTCYEIPRRTPWTCPQGQVEIHPDPPISPCPTSECHTCFQLEHTKIPQL